MTGVFFRRFNMGTEKLKLIITGCPCSGTTYVSRLLRHHGYDARHESLDFKRESEVWWLTDPAQDWPEIEVSYVMNQWLDSWEIMNVPVMLLLRRPERVISSWVAKGMLHNGKADTNDKMLQCSGFNERTISCGRLASIHRIDEDPDERLLEYVSKYAVPTVHESERPGKPGKKSNSHNPGLVQWDTKGLFNLSQGPRFLKTYQPFYPNCG